MIQGYPITYEFSICFLLERPLQRWKSEIEINAYALLSVFLFLSLRPRGYGACGRLLQLRSVVRLRFIYDL